MDDKTKIRLTSAEIGALWTQYINDTAAICVLTYFLKKVEDEEVKPIIEFAIKSSSSNIEGVKEIFDKENFPHPVGFTDADVNPDAPRLFSDTYMLMYLRNMSILGMTASSLSLGLITRSDVVLFFKGVLKSAIGLHDQTRELMLSQGTYIRPPFISVPDEVDFVERQNFLAGFLGQKRPLTAIEITHIFLNIQTNQIGKTLITGFAQTAQNKDVTKYLLRGKDLAQKHVITFSEFLNKADLPAPMSWDTALTDSTTAIFSDKLIMYHAISMIVAGITNYGAALAASQRKDVGAKYALLMPEITLYAEDGANILIKHGWMEQPPTTDDRNKLAKEN